MESPVTEMAGMVPSIRRANATNDAQTLYNYQMMSVVSFCRVYSTLRPAVRYSTFGDSHVHTRFRLDSTRNAESRSHARNSGQPGLGSGLSGRRRLHPHCQATLPRWPLRHLPARRAHRAERPLCARGLLRGGWHPGARDVLQRIHETMAGRLRYVISSTWRQSFDRGQMRDLFRKGGLGFMKSEGTNTRDALPSAPGRVVLWARRTPSGATGTHECGVIGLPDTAFTGLHHPGPLSTRLDALGHGQNSPTPRP